MMSALCVGGGTASAGDGEASCARRDVTVSCVKASVSTIGVPKGAVWDPTEGVSKSGGWVREEREDNGLRTVGGVAKRF